MSLLLLQADELLWLLRRARHWHDSKHRPTRRERDAIPGGPVNSDAKQQKRGPGGVIIFERLRTHAYGLFGRKLAFFSGHLNCLRPAPIEFAGISLSRCRSLPS